MKEKKDKIRVLVADDHWLAREGLKVMLGADPELELVGMAANGQEAVELVDKCQPDVVLMDVRMPVMDGIEATRTIKAKYPEVSVLMLTVYENEVYVSEAIEAGAAGYLLKDVSQELLCHMMHAVYEGGALLPEALFRETLRTMRSSRAQRQGLPAGAVAFTLTPREGEVLGLIVEGMANKEIAAALGITEDTVKKHVQGVIGKLGVSDRTQAAVKAIREGLVE